MGYKPNAHYTLYSITCLINNKLYIGVANVYTRRVNQHKALLKQGKHRSKSLQEDFELYGEDNFAYDIINQYESKYEAYRQEKYYTDYVLCLNKDICYNSYNGGLPYFGFGTYIKRSKEHIAKSVAWLKGHKQSAETIAKRVLHLKGRTYSKESIDKMRDNCWCARKVVDTANNCVYNSLKEAAKVVSINEGTLRSWMKYPNRNKTNLKWLV
jgi:group I intron endonuclease